MLRVHPCVEHPLCISDLFMLTKGKGKMTKTLQIVFVFKG